MILTAGDLARAPSAAVPPHARVHVGGRRFLVGVLMKSRAAQARSVLARLREVAPEAFGAELRAARARQRLADRRWRARHPDAWKDRHRAKVARWRARHPDVARAIQERYDRKRRPPKVHIIIDGKRRCGQGVGEATEDLARATCGRCRRGLA